MNAVRLRPKGMRHLFCLLVWFLAPAASASDATLTARLFLATDSVHAPSTPALRRVVDQFASKGVRSASVLDTDVRVQQAHLESHAHTLDVRIEAMSLHRARILVTVDAKGKSREVALEIPKDREVLIGVGRTEAGLLVASLNVNGPRDGP